jgi:ribonuclease BN (tRNA processing enzyme)
MWAPSESEPLRISTRAFADTNQEGVLVFKCGAGCVNLMQNIEVDASQVAAIFLASIHFALQVQEGNFISGDWCDLGTQKPR